MAFEVKLLTLKLSDRGRLWGLTKLTRFIDSCASLPFPFLFSRKVTLLFSKPLKQIPSMAVFFAIFGTGALTRDVSNCNEADNKTYFRPCTNDKCGSENERNPAPR